MILDFSAFTWFHVILSLIALISGLMLIPPLLKGESAAGLTSVYLASSVATDVTGFFFPFTKFMPSHGVGLLSLMLMAVAVIARYVFHYAGAWRWLYAVCMMLSIYFLAFVTVVQAFMKVLALQALAPTQSEPPFAITQLVVLVIFAALTIATAIKFRPAAMRAA